MIFIAIVVITIIALSKTNVIYFFCVFILFNLHIPIYKLGFVWIFEHSRHYVASNQMNEQMELKIPSTHDVPGPVIVLN